MMNSSDEPSPAMMTGVAPPKKTWADHRARPDVSARKPRMNRSLIVQADSDRNLIQKGSLASRKQAFLADLAKTSTTIEEEGPGREDNPQEDRVAMEEHEPDREGGNPEEDRAEEDVAAALAEDAAAKRSVEPNAAAVEEEGRDPSNFGTGVTVAAATPALAEEDGEAEEAEEEPQRGGNPDEGRMEKDAADGPAAAAGAASSAAKEEAEEEPERERNPEEDAAKNGVAAGSAAAALTADAAVAKEEAETTAGAARKRRPPGSDGTLVVFPAGKIGIFFKGIPPRISGTRPGSFAADCADIRLGRTVTYLRIPGRADSFNLTAVELGERLNNSIDVEGRAIRLEDLDGASE